MRPVREYQGLVRQVLEDGSYRQNRTGVDTIATFSAHYSVDLQEGFPLLTTKKMDGFRWNSLMHELVWYFSGKHHIRELREETGIWDAWADDDGNLPTAYGRFWRRFPIPGDEAKLDGEWWADDTSWYSKAEDWYGNRPDGSEIQSWVNEEDGVKTFDQLRYVIDTINGDHPHRSENSRRLVVSAWHPANASVSKLPPCHFTFVVVVQDGELNVHLTQRSGDIALGVPFNIASYALLAHVISNRTGLPVGEFSHTVTDCHIYCGKGERGQWYRDNLSELQRKVEQIDGRETADVRGFIEENAPDQDGAYDHVPGLLRQLGREPKERPSIEIRDKPLDELEFEDFELADYNSHPGIQFDVAE